MNQRIFGMKNIYGLLMIGLFLLAGTTGSRVFAQTWYVDVNSTVAGSGNGTQQDPFKTIRAAVQAANAWGANPVNTNVQKTIFVAAGTYTGENYMDITVSRLRIVGNPGATDVRGPDPNAPVIDGLNVNDTYCFGIGAGVDSIQIEGFFIRNYGGTPNPEFTTQAAPGCVTGGSNFGTGIQSVNSSASNSDAIMIHDNEFENLKSAIFLTSPGCGGPPASNVGGKFTNLSVRNNVVRTGSDDLYGMYFENLDDALIDNNLIQGNEVVSSDVGIEINVRNNTGQTGGAGTAPNTIISDNITVSNNDFEWNELTNLVVSTTSDRRNTIIRDIVIENNRFTNNNTSSGGTAFARLLRLYDRFSQPTIESITVRGNTMNYFITRGNFGGSTENWAIRIRDVTGTNSFVENTYTSQFEPLSLIVDPPTGPTDENRGAFHAIGIDYDQNPGNWDIMRNTFNGHDINKPNDIGSAVYIRDLTNQVQRVSIENNVITKFRSALRVNSNITDNELSSVSMNFNNLAGLTMGVVNKSTPATGSDPNTRQVVDASFNWWGDVNAETVGNYADGINTATDCTAGPATNANSTWTSPTLSAQRGDANSPPNVDYTPWLASATDTDAGTPGFQPDFSFLYVDRNSPQSPAQSGYICQANGVQPVPLAGTFGRVGEALESIESGGTVFIYDRGVDIAYNEGYANDITKPVRFDSDGSPLIDNLRLLMPNADDRLTLLAPLRISQLLDLQNGKINLGNNNLTVVCLPGAAQQPIISGGSPNSYVITSGTGVLSRDCMGGSTGFTGLVKFPVGTFDYYAPATLRNDATDANLAPDRFSVRVVDQVYEVPNVINNPFTSVARTTWFVNETCPNTVSPCTYAPSITNATNTVLNNSVDLTLEWYEAREGASFNREQAFIKEYTSSGWVAVPGTGGTPDGANGVNPYTRTAADLSGQFINKAFAVFSECPSPPTVPSSLARCDAGPLTITVAFGPAGNPPVTPDAINIYAEDVGGAPLATFTTSPAEFTTPSLTVGQMEDYYVTTSVNGGCETARQRVVVAVGDQPSAPVVSQNTVSRCGPGVVTFTAQMGAMPGSVIYLVSDVDNPTTSIIASDNTADGNGNYELTLPASISATTGYGIYVSSTQSCNSTVVPVTASIVETPGAPGVSDVVRCGPGDAMVTATMGSPAGTELRLYTQMTGGSAVVSDATAPYVLTATTSATVTWFVESFNATAGCASTRTPVTVTVSNPQTIAAPAVSTPNLSRCGPGQVTIVASFGGSGADQFRIYEVPTGGMMVAETTAPTATPASIPVNVTNSSTLYVAARSSATGCESTTRAPVVVNVTQALGAPSAVNGSRCGSGQVVFTANMGAPAGSEIRLYTQQVGGNPVFIDNTGPTYTLTSPTITTTQNFYLASANSGCESIRTQVTATVTPQPGVPDVPNAFLCEPGIATFMPMMGTPAGSTIRMYAEQTGGTVLASSSVMPYMLSTPVTVTTNTTYWFTSVDASMQCESPRTPGTAFLNATLSPPIVEDVQVCGPGPVTINAQMGPVAGNQMRLFTQPTGGNPVVTDNTAPYQLTATANAPVTWFVESFNTATQCTSASRTPVTVTFLEAITAPVASSVNRCGSGTVTFTVSNGLPQRSSVRLYTQASGGNPVDVDDFPPYLLSAQAGQLGMNSYFLATFDPGRGCESARTEVQASVQTPPDAPAVMDVSRCGSGVLTFTAVMGANAGTQIRMYTVPAGGELLATDLSFPYELATPGINNTQTFYFAAYDAQTGCPSSIRTEAIALINPNPGAPNAPNVNLCEGGIATVSASIGTPPGDEVYLYDSPSEPIPLAGTNVPPFELQTPNLLTTTTFYVGAASSVTGCNSPRSPVIVRVVDNPAPPIAQNLSRCGSGAAVITATMSFPAGTQIELYDAAFGGAPILTDASAPWELTTPSVGVTTNFYLETVNTETGCRSSSRTPVTLTINTTRPGLPSASDLSRCGSGSVSFTAFTGFPGGSELRLYATPGGGTPVAATDNIPGTLTSPMVNNTTTFYVAVFDEFTTCESPRLPVTAEVIPTPGAPTGFGIARCGTGQVTITAFMGSPVGDELRLYDTDMGGVPISTDATASYELPTSFISTTTTFYVASHSDQTGCESPRAPIIATINMEPAPPTAENQVVCGGSGSATFNAVMGEPAGDEARLFTQPAGGLQVASANVEPFLLSTPDINSSRVYYLESFNSGTGCVSTGRTPVLATVNPNPAPGTPATANATRCGAGTVTLTATQGTPEGNAMRFYQQSVGGPLVGQDLVQPFEMMVNVSTHSTYYVASANVGTGCESPRVPIQVTVNEVPDEPSAMNVARCESGAVTITATMGVVAGNEMRLYESSTGGNPVNTDNIPAYELITPTVDLTTNFYVEAVNTNTGCASNRTEVTVSITSPPSVPNAVDVSRCGSGSVTYTVTNGLNPGTEMRLYETASGGFPIAEDDTEPFVLSTPTLFATTTFYIESFSVQTGCASSTRREVLATVNPELGAPVVSNVTRCGPGSVTFSPLMTLPQGNEMRVYETDMGGTPLATDNTPPYRLLVPNVGATSTYYIASYNAATGCESPRQTVVATVNPLVSTPVADAVTRCGTGQVTITASGVSANANQIAIYTQPTGGSPLALQVGAPFEVTLSDVLTSTQYYLEASNTATGCASPRSSVVVNINLQPGAPGSFDVARCGPGTLAITAQMSNPAGTEIRLYDAPSGGNPLTTAATSPYVLTTPSLSNTTLYYLSSFDAATGCESSRTPVTATVNTLPGEPFGFTASRCGTGQVMLSANMGTPPGNEMRLYASPVSGSPVAADNLSPFTMNTPSIGTTTTFYIESANTQTGCVSARRAVVAQVNPRPGRPTTFDVQRCGPGSVTFDVSMGSPVGSMVRLYAGQQSTSPIAIDASSPYQLSTPLISTSTVYYVASMNASNNCESERVQVTASINTLPGTPTAEPVARCGAGSATISASMGSPSGTELRLYNDATGGTPISTAMNEPFQLLTSVINTSATYYLESYSQISNCSSSRTPVTVSINPVPNAASSDDINRCGPGRVTFSATMGAVPGTEIRLFDRLVGGTQIAADNNAPYRFETSMLFFATQYYLEVANTITGCISTQRTPVTAFINTAPSAPQAVPARRCGAGIATITAFMGLNAGTEMRLYSTQDGGQPLVSDNTLPYELETPFLNNTTTFYLASAVDDCESQRTPVVVEIGATPSAPILGNVQRCGSGEVVFTGEMGSIGGNEIRLYNAPSGGRVVSLATESPYLLTVPNVVTTTTYYASALNNAGNDPCESPRTTVIATVGRLPGVPSATNVSRCGPGQVTITALAGPNPGSFIRLYDSETGGQAIDVQSETTALLNANLSTTTTLYVANATDQCESGRAMVMARVSDVPSLPFASSVNRCGPGQVTISASMGSTSGDEIRLYDAPTAGSVVAVAQRFPYNLTVNNLNRTTVYYVASVLGNCVSERLPVQASVSLQPSVPTADNISRCGTGLATFTAMMGDQPGAELRLYDAQSEGNLLSVATSAPYLLTTSQVSTNTDFYISSAIGNCESGRRRVRVSVTSTPSAPVANSVTRCGFGPVTVTAFMGSAGGSEIRFYDAGNNLLASDNTSPYTFTGQDIFTTTTYFVASANANCESERTTVVARVDEAPSLPSAANVARCGAGPLTFSAFMGALAGSEIRLYDARTGGNLIASANTVPYQLTVFQTAPTASYYLSAAAGDCESPRAMVVGNTTATPPTPAAGDVRRCGPGVVTFSAVIGNNVDGAELRLYDAPTGGAIVATATDAPFTLTPSPVNTTTTYYLGAALGNCEGNRRPVVASVVSIPSAPLASVAPTCDTRAVTFTVTPNSDNVTAWRIYSQPTGGTALINASGNTSNIVLNNAGESNYYVAAVNGDCESVRTQVEITTGAAPILNVATNNVSCSNLGRIEAGVEGAGPEDGFFFRLASGGTIIASNSTGVFDNLSQGTYTVSTQSRNGCGATREVTVDGPPAPVITTVDNRSDNSATVRWQTVNGASQYLIQYRPINGGSFVTVSAPGTANSRQLFGLLPGTQYEVQVRALCQTGRQTPYSTLTTFQTTTGTTAQACPAPSGLAVSGLGGDQAQIRWTPLEGGVTCYVLAFGPTGTSPDTWSRFLVPHPVSSLSVADLNLGQSYTVRLAANCSGCASVSGNLSAPVETVYTHGSRRDAGLEADASVEVYPNPTSGLLNLELEVSEAQTATFRLLDLTGRTLQQETTALEAGSQVRRLNLDAFAPGVYLLELEGASFRRTIRVIRR